MKVYILRHGEKESDDFYWNDDLNQYDPPLTDKGKNQAIRIMEYFKNKQIDNMFISQFKRTMETIKPLSREKNIIPVIDNNLDEINIGLFAKLKDEKAKQSFYDEWKCLNITKQDFLYPEGESGKDVLKRVKKFFQDLEEKNKNTLIVTHEGWIKIAICHILNLSADARFHFTIDMGSILEIEYDEKINYWKILKINHSIW